MVFSRRILSADMRPTASSPVCGDYAAVLATVKDGRVGTKDCSFAPLTEPDMRASHPALWIDMSELQHELGRDLRWVKTVPHRFERGHPSVEP